MSRNEKPIGLVGVGLLGTAISERLLKQGYSVYGYDVAPQQLEGLGELGGEPSHDLSHVFLNCETILLSLPTSHIAGDVMQLASSVLGDQHLIIDTTTGAPDEMQAIDQRVRQCGADYLEATVAGSSDHVRAGQVVLFIGGEPAHVDRVRPLLTAISPQHFFLGPVGSASRFKLVHNLVLGLNRAVLAEGLSFAEAEGFEASQALEILMQTPAASAIMEVERAKDGDRRLETASSPFAAPKRRKVDSERS